jgi:hypothetical protein
LRISEFRSALSDASSALDIDPTHTKSKHRKCKALVGLRKFVEAKNVLPDYERDPDLDSKTRATIIRGVAEEVEGKYDVSAMMKEVGNGPRLTEHADYQSPDIKIELLPSNKGRGVIAQREITSGTIVMAVKAAAIVFKDEVPFTLHINAESKRIKTATQGELAAELGRGVMSDPDFGERLYTLFDGSHSPEKVDSSYVDIQRIERIVRYNAFNGTSLVEHANMKSSTSPKRKYNRAKDKSEVEENPTGLWIQPSFLNHSCDPNCVWFCVGDYMFVVTRRGVKKDEELTTTYADLMATHAERSEKLLSGFDFVCSCERCQFFSSQPHLIALEQELEKEFEPVHQAVFSAPKKALPILFDIVSRCENGFGVHIKHTACHFVPLTAIVAVYEQQGDLNKVIRFSHKAIEVAGHSHGRGSTYWVMTRMHEVAALVHLQREYLPLLRDTYQAFKSMHHTTVEHFQQSYWNSLSLNQELPNLSKVLK